MRMKTITVIALGLVLGLRAGAQVIINVGPKLAITNSPPFLAYPDPNDPTLVSWLTVISLTGTNWYPNETVTVYMYGPLNSLGFTPTDRAIGTLLTASDGSLNVGSLTTYAFQTVQIPFDNGVIGFDGSNLPNIPAPGNYSLHAVGAHASPIDPFIDRANAGLINLCPNPNGYLESDLSLPNWQSGRGGRDGQLGDHSPERLDPEWMSVWSKQPVAFYATVAQTDTDGNNQPAFISHQEWPGTHYAHDVNLELVPDPQYKWVLGTANFANAAGLASHNRLEWEWETQNNGNPLTYGTGNIGIPTWATATAGDRVYTVGRWPMDNGHPDSGDRTEIHPARLLATMRQRNTAVPFVPGTMTRASQVDIYVSGHGGGANQYYDGLEDLLDNHGAGGTRINDYMPNVPGNSLVYDTYYAFGPSDSSIADAITTYLGGDADLIWTVAGPSGIATALSTGLPTVWDHSMPTPPDLAPWHEPLCPENNPTCAPEERPINDMDYDFDVPLPLAPAGATQPQVLVTTHPEHTTAVTETITYENPDPVTGLPTAAHIHLPYNGADNGIYARTLNFYWDKFSPPGEHFVVQFNDVHNTNPYDTDYHAWNLWTDVCGQWMFLTGLNPAPGFQNGLTSKNGDTITHLDAAHFDVYVDAGEQLRVFTFGYEVHAFDYLFGIDSNGENHTLLSAYDQGLEVAENQELGSGDNTDIGGALFSQAPYPISALVGPHNEAAAFEPDPTNGSSQFNVDFTVTQVPSPPLIQVQGTPTDFGQICLGCTTDFVIQVTNTGESALDLSTISISGAGYSLVGLPSLPYFLANGQSLLINVSFSPTGLTQGAGSLTINSTDPTQPSLTFNFAGTVFLPTGSWVSTGSLATARYYHTATLLTNGKLLVAGGYNSGALSSAELRDPITGTWTTTGSLITARSYHTSTLLPNGKVLVVGGQNSSGGYLSSAELYDPTTGTWTATGSLATARYFHTATLLPNGKVLVTGGYGGSGGFLGSSELYDPSTATWTATGSLATARYVHTATLLPNGKVLVAGGAHTGGYLSSAELYDPTAGTWTTTGSLTTTRYAHTATLLPNGKVLAVGGQNSGGGYLSSAELYDPTTGTWTATGSLNVARYGHTATLLPNGRAMVAGGVNGGGYLATAELYDPNSGQWMAAGSLATARYLETATLLPNGKVLAAGGLNTGGYVSSAELYDSTTGIWTETGSLAGAYYAHTATLLPNGKVLVAGGYNGSLYFSSAELYDPNTGQWTATGLMSAARYFHTATLLPNGKVLVAGGANSGGYLATAELYDPNTGTWTATGSMSIARYGSKATLLPNGKVLVTGGYNGGFLATAELYDPNTGQWTATGSMATARDFHTATLLPNGKVLVAGGYNGNYLTSAELYDPDTGTWTATSSMANARGFHTATLLPNGKVLVAGGQKSGGYLSGAELYDPAAGTWTGTGSMATARYGHTATLLPNGKVLMAGGYGGVYLSSAELYDPNTGTWTATASLATGRYFHSATFLPNGKVLVAGGYGNGNLSSAVLYDMGLNFSPSWQPQIVTVGSPIYLGGRLVINGAQFRGISEGSGGNGGQDSPADCPVVQLRSLGNEQTAFLLSTNWSTNTVTCAGVTNLPPGYALATVFVNGIPSTAGVLDIVPVPFQITGLSFQTQITGQNNHRVTNVNVIVTWQAPGGMTNVVQVTNGGPNGSYNTNFVDLSASIVVPGLGAITNSYTDTNGGTNKARYYRVRPGP